MTPTTARLIRRSAKQAAANCLHRTGARRGLGALRRRTAGGTRVLLVAYHRVVPDFDELRRRVIPALLTSVDTFVAQLELLSESYRFVSLGDALDILAARTASDRDVCVVTFDDGYCDFREHALPVLERLGVPATLFISSGYVEASAPLLHDRLYAVLRNVERDAVGAVNRLLERSNRATCLEVAADLERTLGADPAAALADSRLLTWDELRSVHAAGVEIGGHTVDHVCLHNEPYPEVVRQLRESKARIEREVGAPVLDFAYPNGWYTPAVVRALRETGYRSAVTTDDRLNRLGDDPYALKRKIVWESTSSGVRGFSEAVAACNFDGAFASIGLSSSVRGEKADPS
jgi:peptidoglycan/xylan/chitin deacetylase (PgdA/CDA1 family)